MVASHIPTGSYTPRVRADELIDLLFVTSYVYLYFNHLLRINSVFCQ